jgi:hypothetical protein
VEGAGLRSKFLSQQWRRNRPSDTVRADLSLVCAVALDLGAGADGALAQDGRKLLDMTIFFSTLPGVRVPGEKEDSSSNYQRNL